MRTYRETRASHRCTGYHLANVLLLAEGWIRTALDACLSVDNVSSLICPEQPAPRSPAHCTLMVYASTQFVLVWKFAGHPVCA